MTTMALWWAGFFVGLAACNVAWVICRAVERG